MSMSNKRGRMLRNRKANREYVFIAEQVAKALTESKFISVSDIAEIVKATLRSCDYYHTDRDVELSAMAMQIERLKNIIEMEQISGSFWKYELGQKVEDIQPYYLKQDEYLESKGLRIDEKKFGRIKHR